MNTTGDSPASGDCPRFTPALPLKLSHGQHHVKGKPAHRRRGVERILSRQESTACPVNPFQGICRVSNRTGEAVELVDNDAVKLTGLNQAKALLEAGTVSLRTGLIEIRKPADDLVTASNRNGLDPFTLNIRRNEPLTTAARHPGHADISRQILHPAITVASTKQPRRRAEREK